MKRSKMSDWRGDDIDQGLAADFDDSLSGLDIYFSSSLTSSEALLALPNLQQTYKQECENSSDVESCQHPTTGTNEIHSEMPSAPVNTVSSIFNIRAPNLSPTVSILDSFQEFPSPVVNQDRFQYVLGAATSIATKVHEETLTYLNQVNISKLFYVMYFCLRPSVNEGALKYGQKLKSSIWFGQSYEIKLKKLGDLTGFRGKLLKSVVKIIFHERRLQYVSGEQLETWQRMRPGERILDIDIPLSYGVFDVDVDSDPLNNIEFCWDPTKEAGVFVKLNCISTEFTPKKHGGEKGVPFRILIETYTHDRSHMLHSASCQVKVFKPKGADRKHKTDREKMEKRPDTEQGKFQPSYDCTVLTDCLNDNIYTPTPSNSISPTKTEAACYSPSASLRSVTPQSSVDEPPKVKILDTSSSDQKNCQIVALCSDASAQQTTQWLQLNRFSNYVRVFSNFSGADILRLTRDDFIQICGLADGIRLHNALHTMSIKPRLTIYVCIQSESEQVYHALYLENLSCSEFVSKISPLVGISSDKVHDIYIQGPNGIHILMTDEVINNINDESMFIIDILQDQTSDRVRILLKTT
ncbi:Transcription factor CP2 [Nymphon striatum]|nr:Transcription factor CP2 [Nymphon striatum]